MEQKELMQKIIPIRRSLHQHPELEFCETKTARTICSVLDEWGVPYRQGIAKTGIVAELGQKGPVILLRADMDALPVTEETGLSFASQIPGVMHACGHDIHMSCLLGCIMLFCKRPPQQGRIRFVFQPAEEGAGGAEPMIQEGAAEGVCAAAALHVKPGLETGRIACMPGPYYASPDEFSITVTGRGGHGGYPHLAANPLPAAAELVTALTKAGQAIPDEGEKCVLSVCAVNGGNSFNVIPDQVTLQGTVRTFTPLLRARMEHEIGAIADSICKRRHMAHSYVFRKLYPPVYNDPNMTKLLFQTGKGLLGAQNVIRETEPFMGGEDFAYFAQQAPGVLFHLGCGGNAPLHSSRFTAEEECIWYGSRMLEQLARNYFKREGQTIGAAKKES